jgi:hypothetical protein
VELAAVVRAGEVRRLSESVAMVALNRVLEPTRRVVSRLSGMGGGRRYVIVPSEVDPMQVIDGERGSHPLVPSDVRPTGLPWSEHRLALPSRGVWRRRDLVRCKSRSGV